MNPHKSVLGTGNYDINVIMDYGILILTALKFISRYFELITGNSNFLSSNGKTYFTVNFYVLFDPVLSGASLAFLPSNLA